MSSFENVTDRTAHTRCYREKAQIKNCNVMIDGKNIFGQPIKNNIKTYDNIQKISICEGDDHRTGCLLYFKYFKENYKMVAVDLSKEQASSGCRSKSDTTN